MEDDHAARGLGWVICLAALAAAGVFAAGTVLAFSADALAVQTGLGAGFIGLIFGGIATSLPELSTTVSAVRLKQYEMTFSDAFGTNLASLALLFVADVLYVGEPLLNQVGRFSTFAMLLGIAVTAIYLVGLVARPRQAVWRMGIDSLTVLVVSTASISFSVRPVRTEWSSSGLSMFQDGSAYRSRCLTSSQRLPSSGSAERPPVRTSVKPPRSFLPWRMTSILRRARCSSGATPSFGSYWPLSQTITVPAPY